MIFHLYMTKKKKISGPGNVDQNLRQEHLTPFYCKTVSPTANVHRKICVELDMIYQMVE